MTTKSSILAILMTTAVCTAMATVQSSVTKPPLELSGADTPAAAVISKGYQKGFVSWQHSGGKPRLTIKWRAMAGKVSHNSPSPQGANFPYPISRESQDIPTKGFVTAVSVISSTKILIAEVSDWRPQGTTKLYLQEIVWPKVMPDVDIDIATGEHNVSVVLPAFGLKTSLYKGVNIPGRTGVRNIWNKHTGADPSNVQGCFFQFHDSGNLFSASLSAYQVNQVAWTSGAPTGELENPGLLKFRDETFAIKHQTEGYVYISGESDDARETLLIQDVNLDGTIDTIFLLDSAGFTAFVGGPDWSNVLWQSR